MSYNHKHPYKNSPEYRAWLQMNRVYGKNHITDDWWWWKGLRGADDINKRNYFRFFNHLGPRPRGMVLVRPDKDKPFAPGNIAWGTHSINALYRGPFKKFSCARDEELIKELRNRGYFVSKKEYSYGPTKTYL